LRDEQSLLDNAVIPGEESSKLAPEYIMTEIRKREENRGEHNKIKLLTSLSSG
jgi:hypothetical protein